MCFVKWIDQCLIQSRVLYMLHSVRKTPVIELCPRIRAFICQAEIMCAMCTCELDKTQRRLHCASTQKIKKEKWSVGEKRKQGVKEGEEGRRGI